MSSELARDTPPPTAQRVVRIVAWGLLLTAVRLGSAHFRPTVSLQEFPQGWQVVTAQLVVINAYIYTRIFAIRRDGARSHPDDLL